ncbi:glycerophosphocholine phosphodiesterase GPCPD1 isoform X1 [Esox lucius]|uniref:Glycerophosphocholine phosphodiesterase GPCPD1 n=2 Tax=Esox lucius TaxID=8010 RepID=A0A3P8YBV7_ESOLU|nr:glycerophosphocholine phosphodiesterase GPCPD1 isoform X1 [Esox lucius]XP_019911923.2 glycerophosphocholine phosphodiesterase GPCPD1 isoform X1 [Esox lucius]XP_019911924.2 glycerophosphocholine phosphodiesterase GPCPD1 isoform X1 [Esox lucius]
METTQVTLAVRGETSPGEVIAVVGSCEALGSWSHQKAVTLQPVEYDGTLWKRTVSVSRGAVSTYRYFKGHFLESKSAGGPCQVIVTKWETHQQPRLMRPTESHLDIDDGQFGFHTDGVECVDSGWLTCQTEIRLRLHYSKTSPVSITKKRYKKSRFRIKLTLEGVEEDDDDDDEEQSAAAWHKMTTTLETSLISKDGYRSRHSQPECGYALEASQWTEYIIHTMDPDNLELTFEFFEEDMGEHVVPGDAHPGTVGTACLLSSFFVESGKDTGVVTLPIMKQNSRQTLGKVRVDYLVIRPIDGIQCDMSSSFTKYWRKRSAPLDVGHRGAGSTHAAKHTKVRENTIASFKSAANHGAAYVEFDVHLSKDCVPIVYHDLTCCISTKKKGDKHSLELFEVPVKDLTYDQLQQLKLGHVSALKVNDHKDDDDEEEVDEHQPFPSFSQIFQAVPEQVGFNIELKWICQMKDGSWEGNLSSYFNMNLFLDIILSCVLQRAGKRRIVFSCFDPDICTMVRQKQNKYPILFLTQGISQVYPELMDIRCQTTQIAMSFAQSENILGISAHTEELLQNLQHIREAQSKGLVVFCWGDLNNDHDNRTKLREQGIDGLIYDSICDQQAEQPNIFKVEEKHTLQETLKSFVCSCYSIPCQAPTCASSVTSKEHIGTAESDSGLSSS